MPSLTESDAIQASWDAIAAQHSGQKADQADFCVWQIKDKKTLECVKIDSGHAGKAAGGGRGKVVELLNAHSEKLLFGAFKVTGVDNRESTISYRAKYVVFVHKGEACSPLVKGCAGTSNGKIMDIFPGHTITIKSDGDLDDYEPAEIEKSLLAVGGAHKPTSYCFINEYDEQIAD